jgi:DNA-binding transcriptional LysR family regulator
VRLFERTTRDVRLTEAGQAFYERNSRLVDELRDSIALARRTAAGASGRLRVGYMSFAALVDMPHHVRSFRETFPRVSIDLLYSSTQAQKRALARNRLDVGFLIGPFRHPDFETGLVSEERLVALVPSGHPVADQGGITLADLARLPLVMGTLAEWDFYRQMLDALFDARGLSMRVAFEASSSMGMLGLVAGGLGATIFPGCIRRLRPEGVAILEIVDCETPMPTVLAWRRTGLSVTARNFLRVCGELRARL